MARKYVRSFSVTGSAYRYAFTAPDGAMRQGPVRVICYDEVVVGGRFYFMRRGTIDMDALGADLSVSRSMLYGWSRDAIACSATCSGRSASQSS